MRHYLTYQICLDTGVLQAWSTLAQLKTKLTAVLSVFQMHYTKYCKEMLTSAAVEQVHLSLDFSFTEGNALQSTRLPSVWPRVRGSNAWGDDIAWVKFVVESRHCKWRTTLGYATCKSLYIHLFVCLFIIYVFIFLSRRICTITMHGPKFDIIFKDLRKITQKGKNPFSVIPRTDLTLFFFLRLIGW